MRRVVCTFVLTPHTVHSASALMSDDLPVFGVPTTLTHSARRSSGEGDEVFGGEGDAVLGVEDEGVGGDVERVASEFAGVSAASDPLKSRRYSSSTKKSELRGGRI